MIIKKEIDEDFSDSGEVSIIVHCQSSIIN